MLDYKKLQMLRKANGWTYTQLLTELAQQHGIYVPPSSMRAYEKGGIKRCPPELLLALAKLYDVQPEELLTR